jgi:hypothetical protein
MSSENLAYPPASSIAQRRSPDFTRRNDAEAGFLLAVWRSQYRHCHQSAPARGSFLSNPIEFRGASETAEFGKRVVRQHDE